MLHPFLNVKITESSFDGIRAAELFIIRYWTCCNRIVSTTILSGVKLRKENK